MKYQRIPLGPLWTNCFLFWDEAGISFAVDPGGEPSDLLSVVDRHGLQLTHIFLTHGHADHLLGVPELKRQTGARVLMPKDDCQMALHPSASLASMLGATQESFEPDQLFGDGEKFTVGDFQILTLHTPGHTPGSSCLMVSSGDQRVLVSGDTLFARSMGRTDLPGGDEAAMQSSLKRLYNLEGDFDVLPGHGPETRMERERRENPFLNFGN